MLCVFNSVIKIINVPKIIDNNITKSNREENMNACLVLFTIFKISMLLSEVCAALNTKAVLSPFLKECYSESKLLDRNYLPPMTLPVLLDIIRKIEDHPSIIGDMRQIATGIVHLFRQDGIVFDASISDTSNVIPYSPTGFPSYKNRLLLRKLIPSNQFDLPSNILTTIEKCTLHYMMSTSLILHNRGDEEETCNNLVGPEIPRAQYKIFDKHLDVEVFNVKGISDTRGRQIVGVSNCPMETGVVATEWGDVAMGTVITGISSGLEEQNVRVADLVSVKDEFRDSEAYVVNNRYASTLAGDLAEVAIIQGTTRFQLSIGASGGWNSSYIKKHYFLTKNEDLEMTNAEVRGGLDGLVLSELGFAYSNDFPELQVSQILDMYYSTNGVMHERRFRACNRKVLVPDIAASKTLIEQSIGTAISLYHVSQLPSTTDLRGFSTFVNNTVHAFHRFIPLNLNESVCATTTDQVIRPKINLILITEPRSSRRQLIAYIADMIDVGKFGSSITLMSLETGDIVIEKTFSISTFHERLAENLVSHTGSANLVKTLKALNVHSKNLMESEYRENYSGGNATIALFLSDTIPLAGNERMEAIMEANDLRRLFPDLRLIFATGSASETVLVDILHHYDDFIPVILNDMSLPSISLQRVKAYIETAPRRIVNPSCKMLSQNVNSGTVGFEDYVDADGINLYRILPNYFYGRNIERKVRIESTDFGPLTICYSWSNNFPRRNRSTSTVPADVICDSAANQGIVEIDLINPCPSSSNVYECPALYISVASTAVPRIPQCKEFGCRYPNDVKYLVVGHELGCFSRGFSLQIETSLIIINCIVYLYSITLRY